MSVSESVYGTARDSVAVVTLHRCTLRHYIGKDHTEGRERREYTNLTRLLTFAWNIHRIFRRSVTINMINVLQSVTCRAVFLANKPRNKLPNLLQKSL